MRRVEHLQAEGFEWDENKRRSNILKHGIDFPDVVVGLLRPHIAEPSPRQGEPRSKAICVYSGRTAVVVYTMRGDICRIISAWPADSNEKRKYREIFGG